MSFQLVTLLLSSVATTVVLTSSVCLKTPSSGTWIQGQDGYLPPNSVIGGFEATKKTNLHICRVGDIVGKFEASSKSCYIQEKSGKPQPYTTYEILTGVNHTVWVPVEKKQMPCNLLQTGRTANASSYAGRVTLDAGLIPGNVIDGIISIPWTNSNKYETFEALTVVPKFIRLPASTKSYIFGTTVKYLTFKVKSEVEVYVNLGNRDKMEYRVTIGASNNRMSAIGPLSDPLKSFEKTVDILDKKASWGFWLRWISGDLLEFGVEGILKPLVTYSDANVSYINSVVFESTSKQSSWQIANLPEWDNFKFVDRQDEV